MAPKFSILAKKLSKDKNNVASGNEDLVADVKNWYSDRYESILVQRNILLLFSVLSIVAVLISVVVIGNIATSKTIEPFVVEIEDKTGITNVVNPFSRTDLTVNQALNEYFLIKYLTAREAYNPADYDYNYKTSVRLYSTPNVYAEFKYSFANNPKNPIAMYGTSNSTSLKIRSIQFLDPNKTVQIRFTIVENAGGRASYYKIATIEFAYSQMELSLEDRFVNPLGFQITSYVVSDEIIQ